MTTIEQLMKLMQDSRQFYTYDSDSDIEIRYRNRADDEGAAGWGYRPRKQGQYIKFTRQTAVEVFNKEGINFYLIESELLTRLSTVVAYYDLRTKEIEKVLGSDFIQQSLKGFEEFEESLKAAIKKSTWKVIK